LPTPLPLPFSPRITELEERLALEEPGRCVWDVAGLGACFFLAQRLGRQQLGGIERVSDAAALDAAGWSDRVAIVDFMRDRLTVPFRNGDRLELSLARAADWNPDEDDEPPFAGAWLDSNRAIEVATGAIACHLPSCKLTTPRSPAGADGTAQSYLNYMMTPEGWADGVVLAVFQVPRS
jgi:hypothetical protein